MKEILLIGGGGHCRACIDVINKVGTFSVVGIVDNRTNLENENLGYPLIGSDDDLPRLINDDGLSAIITVGQIKSAKTRIEIFNKLRNLKADMPVVVSPLAYLSPNSMVSNGSIVMHCALINSHVKIGENCIINSQALVEHDCIVESHCHISTGAKINGGVHIGEGCFIGSGAVVREGVRLGSKCVVGAGAIVKDDVPPDNIVRI